MAEILALGISHYPPLHGHDDRMSWILKRMLQNPKLPQELRTPAGWPEAMRAEWGSDEGASSAARHRADLVAWMDKTRAALDAFIQSDDPDKRRAAVNAMGAMDELPRLANVLANAKQPIRSYLLEADRLKGGGFRPATWD